MPKRVLQPWEKARKERGRKYLREQYNRPGAYWDENGGRADVALFKFGWGFLAIFGLISFYLASRWPAFIWLGIALTLLCIYSLWWGYKRITSE